MLIYNIIATNSALSSTNDTFTLIANAVRSLGVLEIDAEGDGTTSGYSESAVYRVSTVGTTGGGAITPVPVNSALPATGATVYTSWTTQPTVGAKIQAIPVNLNGQRYFWRAMPNLSNAIWSPAGSATVAAATLSFRGVTTGSGSITLRAQYGEI